jgi:hypothetical protein
MGCDTTSLLFGIGKQSVFKVLKENPDNFKDLSNLADCDVDVSVTAARRLVIKLYDSIGKIEAEDENLNKLRTRKATVKSACLPSRQEGVIHVFFPTKLQTTLRRELCKMTRYQT